MLPVCSLLSQMCKQVKSNHSMLHFSTNSGPDHLLGAVHCFVEHCLLLVSSLRAKMLEQSSLLFFLQALMSLFVLSSKDGWVNIMYDGLDAVGIDQQVMYREIKSAAIRNSILG